VLERDAFPVADIPPMRPPHPAVVMRVIYGNVLWRFRASETGSPERAA
jgi:hypothetical protein